MHSLSSLDTKNLKYASSFFKYVLLLFIYITKVFALVISLHGEITAGFRRLFLSNGSRGKVKGCNHPYVFKVDEVILLK